MQAVMEAAIPWNHSSLEKAYIVDGDDINGSEANTWMNDKGKFTQGLPGF